MTSEEVRKKYLEFFKERGHIVIPSASLVPKDDPTTLLTGSGMQPLIPYLMGEEHDSGKRLVDSQKCFRAEDIEEVGDNRHTTFFEMLGNWSLGDYFKKEQLPWFFEFLTDALGIDPNKLYVTVFAGDEANNIPRDDESVDIWKKLFSDKGVEAEAVELLDNENAAKIGMQGHLPAGRQGRIFSYDAKKNWWSRSGSPGSMPAGELGGPDSEVFYDFETPHDSKYGNECHPNCECGRFLEIGNSVFMEYKKAEDGSFEKLTQRNVDFGGGLERLTAVSEGQSDVFATDLFRPILEKVEELKPGLPDNVKRIFADHIRGTTFLIADGVRPSNKETGYILRRLLRRVIAYQIAHDVHPDLFSEVVPLISQKFGDIYPETKDAGTIIAVMEEEKTKFKTALNKGLNELSKLDKLTAADAFRLYESYGLPFELTKEFAPNGGADYLKREDFEKELDKHKEVSRAGAGKKFGGHGMILDTGELKAGNEAELKKVTRLHTATHLMQAAIREVLGEEARQRGSDITVDRTRFDFTFPRKVTAEELKKIEDRVNEIVKSDLPFQMVEMLLDEAKKSGALYVESARYPNAVKVYYSGESLENAFSREICGGPHVTHTGEVGKFVIGKEEAISGGVRRVKGNVE